MSVLLFVAVYQPVSLTVADDHTQYRQFRDAGDLGRPSPTATDSVRSAIDKIKRSHSPPVTTAGEAEKKQDVVRPVEKKKADPAAVVSEKKKASSFDVSTTLPAPSIATPQHKSADAKTANSGVSTQPTFTHGTSRCDRDFGYASLDKWNSTFADYCTGGSSYLGCASFDMPHSRGPTRPQAFCYGRQMLLDVARASQHISCLKHRPNYNCQSEAFRAYERGAWQAECALADSFKLDLLPKDHLRDIFDGLSATRSLPAAATAAAVTIDEPVLLVTRENTEYANLFHAMSDVINAFAMLYVRGVDAERVRVLLLDDHPEGPYDALWQALSRGGPVLRLTQFEGKKVCLLPLLSLCCCPSVVLNMVPVFLFSLICPSLSVHTRCPVAAVGDAAWGCVCSAGLLQPASGSR